MIRLRAKRPRTPSLLIPILLAVGCSASDASRSASGGEDGRVPAYLDRLQRLGFSGAVLLARGDEVILHEGYGWADSEAEVSANRNTVYGIASLTKQFTAAAILDLVAQGRLRRDTRLAEVFEDVPTGLSDVTVHRLLTHTGGLDAQYGPSFEVIGRDSLLQRIWGSTHEGRDSSYRYSNAGYSILAAMVEVVSGLPWETYLERRLLHPTGLDRTAYLDADWPPEENAVYRVEGATYTSLLDRPAPLWHFIGNGGLMSTVGDLYDWWRALRGGEVVPDSLVAAMFTPHVEEFDGNGTKYGYGWEIRPGAEGRCISHGGSSDDGIGALVAWCDTDDLLVIVLTNTTLNGYRPHRLVADRIRRLARGEELPMPPLPLAAQADLVEGSYRLPWGDSIQLERREDGWYAASDDPRARALLTLPDPALAGADPRLLDRLQRIFHWLDEGPIDSLATEIPPDIGPEAEVEWWRDAWRSLEDRHGEAGGIRYLGTAVTPEGPRHFVQIEFADRPRVVQVLQLREDLRTDGFLYPHPSADLPTAVRIVRAADGCWTHPVLYPTRVRLRLLGEPPTEIEILGAPAPAVARASEDSIVPAPSTCLTP